MSTLALEGIEIPSRALTFDGFREWYASLDQGGQRIHFRQGTIYIEMSQDFRTHAPVVRAVHDVLSPLAREQDLGEYYGPPSWISHEATGLSTEPDGFLVLWSSFESGLVRLNPARSSELLGRPDMALEVVSRSSVKKDLRDLVESYAEAGVREYWIADARGEQAVLRILVPGDGGGYSDQAPDTNGWVASPLWRRSFRLVRSTNRVGMPDFRLASRA